MNCNKSVIAAILLLFLFSFSSAARQHPLLDFSGSEIESGCARIVTVAENEKDAEDEEEVDEEPDCD